MTINDFFKQIDDTTRLKELENEAVQAQKRVFTQTTINFAEKLSKLVQPYITEFEKRGFKCKERTGDFPYWSLEVRKKFETKIQVAIITGHQQPYEIAFYINEERRHAPIHISNEFNKTDIEKELQHLFKQLL